MSYRIVQIEGKYAIVDEKGRQISQLFDYILEAGLVKGQSPYYIAEKDGKWAIFDKDGNMITPGWFKFVYEDGLVEGTKNFYLAVREDEKYAIFDVNGNMLTQEWYDYIDTLDLFKEEGEEVYIAEKDGKRAIFDIDGNQLTKWKGINEEDNKEDEEIESEVYQSENVNIESKYKVVKVDGKYAIVDENGDRISPLFDFIYEEAGLLKNESPYYIACIGWEFAIFDVNGNMISPRWFRFVDSDGLVRGQKDIYIAMREDGKEAIFNVYGEMVSPRWFDKIIPLNLFKEEDGDLYLAFEDGKMAIFDLDGNQRTEWQEAPIKYKQMIEMEKWSNKIFDEYVLGRRTTSKDKVETRPEVSQSNNVKKSDTGIDFFERFKAFKYHDALGILEITDEQGNSTAIELKYKEDLELKKGPNS
ncbi:MAG: hypothetical protein ACP5JX_04015, partial [Sulfurihydrogenibium sp.]